MQQPRESLKTTVKEKNKNNPFGPMLDKRKVNFKGLGHFIVLQEVTKF